MLVAVLVDSGSESTNFFFLALDLLAMLSTRTLSQLCLVFLKLVVFFCQLDHACLQIVRLFLKYVDEFLVFQSFVIRCMVLHRIQTILLSVLKGLLADLFKFFLLIIAHHCKELATNLTTYPRVFAKKICSDLVCKDGI